MDFEQTNLEKSISFYNQFVKGKQFNDEKLQDILSDCFFRYIHLWEFRKGMGEIKLLDCIKGFNKSKNGKKRIEEIKDQIILKKFNETNKLLLMKCIYYETIYEIIS